MSERIKLGILSALFLLVVAFSVFAENSIQATHYHRLRNILPIKTYQHQQGEQNLEPILY